jgi:hypothetical protein
MVASFVRISCAVVALGIALGGCRNAPPQEGAACASSSSTCRDEHTALVCQGGKYFAAPCPGADGCHVVGDAARCDFRGAPKGAACVRNDDEPLLCAEDGRSAFSCVDGKVKRDRCGAQGCELVNGRMRCDVIPEPPRPGEPCKAEGADRCAEGNASYVTCKAGTWQLTSTCRGPLGCKWLASLESIACDVGVAQEGDACASGESCTADGSTWLVCREGKFVSQRRCRGPLGCKESKADRRHCDQRVAEAGDTCDSGDRACNSDGTTTLVCNAGSYALDARCAAGKRCALGKDGKPGCR